MNKKFNYTRWVTENKHGSSLDIIYEQIKGKITESYTWKQCCDDFRSSNGRKGHARCCEIVDAQDERGKASSISHTVGEGRMCEMCGGMHEGPCPNSVDEWDSSRGSSKGNQQTWNCVNGQCIDPYDGSGQYTTINDCLDNCVPLDTCECGCKDPNALNNGYCCAPSGMGLPVMVNCPGCCEYSSELPQDIRPVDENKSGGCGCGSKK